MNITGTLFSYSYLCKRKTWLYHHRISFENQSDLVEIGKALDQTTYARENHHIDIDGLINIDYIKNNVVHEVKKSDKVSEMTIQQLKYYLYILREKGIIMTGKINFPLLKKTTTVHLEQQDIDNIEIQLQEINKLLLSKTPPIVEKNKFCFKCAYYDFCFSE